MTLRNGSLVRVITPGKASSAAGASTSSATS
jgi:hypothetical protein